jgi:hypothetical protein
VFHTLRFNRSNYVLAWNNTKPMPQFKPLKIKEIHV